MQILGGVIELTKGKLPEEIRGPINGLLKEANKIMNKPKAQFNIPYEAYHGFEDRVE